MDPGIDKRTCSCRLFWPLSSATCPLSPCWDSPQNASRPLKRRRKVSARLDRHRAKASRSAQPQTLRAAGPLLVTMLKLTLHRRSLHCEMPGTGSDRPGKVTCISDSVASWLRIENHRGNCDMSTKVFLHFSCEGRQRLPTLDRTVQRLDLNSVSNRTLFKVASSSHSSQWASAASVHLKRARPMKHNRVAGQGRAR